MTTKMPLGFLFYFILMISGIAQSQIENPFFSKNKDESYTFFFTETFAVSCENKADYKCILKFNEEHFVLNDSIKFYYQKNKKIALRGFYNNGKKEGIFTWYFPNGKIQRIGQYYHDERLGIWRDYYSNGQLKKEVEYRDNNAFLVNFYLDNGEQLVSDGEGNFSDEIAIYSNPKNLPKLSGPIKEGLMDGKWQIYVENSLIATEYFEDKKFIKGVSSAANNKSEYQDAYYSTFVENIFIENLSFSGNFYCGMLPGAKVKFSSKLYESLNRLFKKFDIAKEVESGWFFVRVYYNNNGKIAITEMISNQNEQINKKVEEIIRKTHIDYISYNVDILVPIVIEKHQVYFENSNEVLLFKG